MTDQSSPAGRPRVLVVEDDPQAALFVDRVLGGMAGFEVGQAPDPMAAQRAVRNGQWDLVITDIELPTMTGIELLDRLRELDPLLPVAVLTAYATVDNAIGALRGKADEFLEKPVRAERLIELAKGLVAKGREARQAGQQRVLAIGAHPDDIEIGAGGTLLAHRSRGHQVSVLTLSRGARGGLEGKRADESARAARLLGADLYLEDLTDMAISEGEPTISAITSVIDQVRPTILYTHSVHDVHQDHRNTHRAAMVASLGIGRIYCFQSPSAMVDFGPSLFVGIDDQLPGKLATIGAYVSQTSRREYLEPDLIESTARYWARFAQARYAEAFEVMRDLGGVPTESGRSNAHA